MLTKSKIKMASNRSFGLVFFFVLLIVSIWPISNGESFNLWILLISTIFLTLGLLNSTLLTPLNKLWFKLGIFLGNLISPIVMGIIFFLVVTPIGIIMQILGKDLLKIKFSKKKKSYWIIRKDFANTMKRQF